MTTVAVFGTTATGYIAVASESPALCRERGIPRPGAGIQACRGPKLSGNARNARQLSFSTPAGIQIWLPRLASSDNCCSWLLMLRLCATNVKLQGQVLIFRHRESSRRSWAQKQKLRPLPGHGVSLPIPQSCGQQR